jgi:hypothetical protein
MNESMKLKIFRIASLLNGAAMVATGLYGVFAPGAAMGMMTGMDHPWDAETISLMRMHNGADFGLGVGFALVAWRPHTSFAALVLCLFANVAHGVVHVVDEAHGHHHLENIGPIGILIVMSLAIAVLYPWREGWERFQTT